MKTIWIGIDDTDSTTGGCTTFVARIIIQELQQDYEIIGYPRLVRLNPNIPWKTRGNGALSFQVGKKGGKIKRKIGESQGQDIYGSLTFTEELGESEQKDLIQIVKRTIETHARTDDDNTNPGYVITRTQPEPSLYKKAVTQIVDLDEVLSILHLLHATFEGYKNKRGLIGAAAAIAWEPLDRTFELIAYRQPNRWGTPREVDGASAQQLQNKYPTTFDNYDTLNHHNRIVPHSPCPILYGIRGDNIDDLAAARADVKSEQVDSWLLFISNQGTDDHLQQKHITAIHPYESVITEGIVQNTPHTIQGGHVLFTIQDNTGTIPCAAYEPTKEFRTIIRALRKGDTVRAYGGVREQPLTINLEKILLQNLAVINYKKENPVCPACGKHMKSKGTDQGYQCIRCNTKSTSPTIDEERRTIQAGFYEVPVCARRHLSEPLQRMKQEKESLGNPTGNGSTPQ